MFRTPLGLFADEEASMLADLAQLTPEPTALGSMLAQLGYRAEPFGAGLYAAGERALPVLLFPLYTRAGLAIRKRQLVGRNVSRSAAMAAGLAALRSSDRRPPLLFLMNPSDPPAELAVEQVVAFEGGLVPRIWRHCFGSFDVLVRIIGQPSHPGLSNTAVNAIETAIPVLQALIHLKADIKLRAAQRRHYADAPLQPRLTINAAHGGSTGSLLPTVFDVLVNRRYDPAETLEAAMDEIRSAAFAAAPRSTKLELAVTQHNEPVADPDEASRSREERALAAGWGWPQVRFCNSSALMPGATILGGLERLDHDGGAEDASTTLDEMTALARSIRALLREC